jgi:hypothetical protein
VYLAHDMVCKILGYGSEACAHRIAGFELQVEHRCVPALGAAPIQNIGLSITVSDLNHFQYKSVGSINRTTLRYCTHERERSFQVTLAVQLQRRFCNMLPRRTKS